MVPKGKVNTLWVVGLASRGYPTHEIQVETDLSMNYVLKLLRENKKEIERNLEVHRGKIRTLLWEGWSVHEIAEELSLNLAHVVDEKVLWLHNYGLMVFAEVPKSVLDELKPS